MSVRVGVRCSAEGFAAACAELPRRVVATAAGDGIVALAGAGDWVSAARAAVDAGARAIVIADPSVTVDEEALEALAMGVPVVLDRARIRADVLADAGPAAPVAVTAECLAAPSDLPIALVDAVSWLGALAGAPAALSAYRSVAGGVLAQFEAGGAALSLVATRLAEGHGVMRMLAFGPQRTEVSIDVAGVASVRHDRADGSVLAASRFESRRRLALRRALDALERNERPADARDFAHCIRTLRPLLDVL